MFNSCRRWRQKLSQHADGTLPPAQWNALEKHLARCPHCRCVEEADRALSDVLGLHTGMLDNHAARVFDDRVLAALRDTGATAPTRGVSLPDFRQWIRTCRAALPNSFLTQVAGGGLVAASVTMLCLLSSLHARSPVAPRSDHPASMAAMSVMRNEPPVPLESLLRSPAPRAALLWSSRATTGNGKRTPPPRPVR
jgi:anti-sigma factor RsiW